MAAEVERLAGPRRPPATWPSATTWGGCWRRVGPVHRPQLRRPGRPGRPLALPRLARPGGFRRLHNLVATHLTDWRLRRAHTSRPLYTGLSPFDALGIYAVVAHMDTVGGAFFPAGAALTPSPWPRGGREGRGPAAVDPGERVEGETGGVAGVLAGGERLAAGDVVVTSDLPAAYAHLLPPAARDWRPAAPAPLRPPATWSTSG